MRALLLLFFGLMGVTISALAAPSGLRAARHAQALLGPETWSQVVRIENENTRSLYDPTVYALIFEFAGILWFYTDADGTQSFSLYKNRLEKEKADLSPGLREIDPGFRRFERLNTEWVVAPNKALPNGCFIESIAAGRTLLASRGDIGSAQLLLIYASGVRAGHCVFAFEAGGAMYVVDPAEDGRPRRVTGNERWDAEQLAGAVWPQGRGSKIQRVRTVGFPLPESAQRPPLFACADAAANTNCVTATGS
jgi:hypothetical protein